MKKSFWILGAVALCGAAFTACDDEDEGGQAAVGILSATVTPAGSAISYTCEPTGTVLENRDSVRWDVSDAALANARISVRTTIGCTAYYNGQPISADSTVIDVTAPVTLQVSNDATGASATYTLKVVRATTASGEAMILQASSFQGFPAASSLIDWDMAYFNDKFYAIVTSLDGEMENYQLFSSLDGLNWQEVAYQTSLAGTSVPDSVGGYVIGGEGARLAVFKDKMYVLGGARTKGADKYGNAAEVSDGWFGPSPSLSVWRSYSTSDGVTFECDTVGMTYSVVGDTVTRPYSQLACTAMIVAELDGKLYMKSGFAPVFGSWQCAQNYAYTENGKDWIGLNPEAVEDRNMKGMLCDAFFSFKGKLWAIGGFTNFISANWMTNSIYSSEDGVNWQLEGTLPENMTNLFGMKVVAGENVAYMFGGETFGEGGNEFAANQIFRSEDGVNWEAVEMPAGFTSRRNARGTLVGNQAWLFGGNASNASGNYAYPADGDEYVYDTWTVLLQ